MATIDNVKAIINNEKVSNAFFNLYDRRRDESEYEDIKEYVRTHMDKTKVPRYVRFVDAFPMNAAGKILKYKMREEAVDYLNLHEANSIVTA